MMGSGFIHNYKTRLVALFLFIFLFCLLGLTRPAALMAKSDSGSPATQLTVTLNDGGVVSELTTYTIDELKKMPQVEREYSSIDSMPAPVFTAGRGVDLESLLSGLNIDLTTISKVKFYATDSVNKTITEDKLLNSTRYYYPQIVKCWPDWDATNYKYTEPAKVSEGAVAVKPILAIVSSQDRSVEKPDWNNLDGTTCLRLCLGQSKPEECTTMDFIRWIYKIEVFGKLKEGTPKVVLTTPTTGQNYQAGDKVAIQGSAQKLAAVTVEVSNPNGEKVYTLGNIAVDNNIFSTEFILGANAVPGSYVIKVSGSGMTQDYTQSFKVILPNAAVKLSAPTSTQSFKPGDKVTVVGTVYEVTGATLTILNPSGQSIYTSAINGSGDFTREFTLTENAALGDYSIKVSAPGLAQDYSANFKVTSTGEGQAKGQVILSIKGDGLSAPVEFTRSALEALQDRFVQHTYTTINRVPARKEINARGIPLSYLLEKAGVNLSSVRMLDMTAADGYNMTFTKEELLQTSRYIFPQADSRNGQIPAETIIALESSEAGNSITLVLGQQAPTEQNSYQWVKDLTTIKLSGSTPGKWSQVTAQPSGGTVGPGTGIVLNHSDVPWKVKIYYTTDGSTPNLDSKIYNYYFELSDNEPIKITQDTIIKAYAIGPGKLNSDVATFTFKYDSQALPVNQIVELTPDKGGTVNLGEDVEVKIPAGALTGSTAVKIKIDRMTTAPKIPADSRLASEVFEFSVGDKNKYNFSKDVTLTLKFKTGEAKTGEVAAIHYYDEANVKWVNIGGTVNGSSISVPVNHFTKFAVLFVTAQTKTVKTLTPAPLQDIANHWAVEKIKKLLALGAIAGYPDGAFRPDATISRAEFTTVMAKAFKLNKPQGKVFSDTAGHWAKDYIDAAVSAGIAGGYNDKRFGPDDPITREQMSVMVVKAARLASAEGGNSFSDSGSIAEWARKGVAAAVYHQLIKGYPDNTFRAQGNATRAEAVTVMVNALKL